MRATKQALSEMVIELNEIMGRPTGAMDIGHLSLDYNRHMGYQLQEELNGLGAVFNHTGRMKISEMKYFLIGMIKGLRLAKLVPKNA